MIDCLVQYWYIELMDVNAVRHRFNWYLDATSRFRGGGPVQFYPLQDPRFGWCSTRNTHYQILRLGGVSTKTNSRVKKVKIYQELMHDVLLVIPKATLDGIPVTMRTMKLYILKWQLYFAVGNRNELFIQCSRLPDTRIEIIIVHVALGGCLETKEILIAQLIGNCRILLQT